MQNKPEVLALGSDVYFLLENLTPKIFFCTSIPGAPVPYLNMYGPERKAAKTRQQREWAPLYALCQQLAYVSDAYETLPFAERVNLDALLSLLPPQKNPDWPELKALKHFLETEANSLPYLWNSEKAIQVVQALRRSPTWGSLLKVPKALAIVLPELGCQPALARWLYTRKVKREKPSKSSQNGYTESRITSLSHRTIAMTQANVVPQQDPVVNLTVMQDLTLAALSILRYLLRRNQLGATMSSFSKKQDKSHVWDVLHTHLLDLYVALDTFTKLDTDSAKTVLLSVTRFGAGVSNDQLEKLAEQLSKLVSVRYGDIYHHPSYEEAKTAAQEVLLALETASTSLRQHLGLVQSALNLQPVWHAKVHEMAKRLKENSVKPREPSVAVTISHRTLLETRGQLPTYRAAAEKAEMLKLSAAHGNKAAEFEYELPANIQAQIRDFVAQKSQEILAKMEAAGAAEVKRRADAREAKRKTQEAKRKAQEEEQAKQSVSSKLSRLMASASPTERALLEKLYQKL